MFQVYILESLKNRRHYVGHTENLEERLAQHNASKVGSTKSNKPWRVVHTESYETKSEAYRRELEIKAYKGGIKFKKLLGVMD
jgi:putative endonuclease